MPSGFFYGISVFAFLVALCLLFGVYVKLARHTWVLVEGKVVGLRHAKSKGLVADGSHDLFDQSNESTSMQVYVLVNMRDKEYELLMFLPGSAVSVGDAVKLRIHPWWPQLLNDWDSAVKPDGLLTNVFGSIIFLMLALFSLVFSLIFFQMA